MHDIDFVPSPYPTSGKDLQNRTENFGNTTSGLGVEGKISFGTPFRTPTLCTVASGGL